MFGKQNNQYNIWLFGTPEGCTTSELRTAILLYEKKKKSGGIDLIDGLILDGGFVNSMRISKTESYPKNPGKNHGHVAIIYIK